MPQKVSYLPTSSSGNAGTVIAVEAICADRNVCAVRFGRRSMTEHCCEELQEAVDNEAILHAPKQRMFGRILNEVDSDYAVRSPEDRPSLYLINFCPFCGRAISRTVWNAEKKK